MMSQSRILLSCLLCSWLVISAGAQPELEQLIGALQKKYDQMSTLTADFTQLYHAPGERARRESGKLWLQKPGRMRWDYTAPENKVFVCDGKWLYEYVAGETTALRSAMKDSDDLRAPFAFLLGRGNLRRDFKLIEFAREAPQQAGNRVLRLVPKRARQFTELLLEIQGNLQLTRLVLLGPNNTRSDFLFSNLRENAPLSAAQFAFKAPAGVKLIEQ